MMHTGKGLVQTGGKRASDHVAKLDTPTGSYNMRGSNKRESNRVDMVDSYFSTGVTSAAVTSMEHPGFDTGRHATLTGVASLDKAKVVSVEEADSDDSSEDNNWDNGMLTTRSVAPPEMPGLSIITWEEFIDNPSMFYKLYTLDKREFIHFDPSILTNFFHDSRMDPPTLGGPSGDGMTWAIYVDSHAHLKQIREILTSRISVLLVDLIKSEGENAAAAPCLLAINPKDDQIRRVLHLTLSRALQTVLQDKCFSIEIDLNQSVQEWCQTVLKAKCIVHGGRIVITNGDPPEKCCLVDDPKRCVLCFPVWAYRRIKYMLHRRRNYEDTRLKFDASSIVLCTNSEKLKQCSEAAQLSNGGTILVKNQRSVTMATQTLNTSMTSLQSEMGVEEVTDEPINELAQVNTEDEKRNSAADDDDGGDNYNKLNNEDDERFDETTQDDERGGLTPAPPPLTGGEDDDDDEDKNADSLYKNANTQVKTTESPSIHKLSNQNSVEMHDTKAAIQQDIKSTNRAQNATTGVTNAGFEPDTENTMSGQRSKPSNLETFLGQPGEQPVRQKTISAMKNQSKVIDGEKKKVKSVAFRPKLTTEYPDLSSQPQSSETNKEKEVINFSGLLLNHNKQVGRVQPRTDDVDSKPQTHVSFSETKEDAEIPSPRSAFILRPDTPYHKPAKPGPVKAFPIMQSLKDDKNPPNAGINRQKPDPDRPPGVPWIGQSNPGNTKNPDNINAKIASRQRKIGLLLKDLIMSSSSVPKGKPKFMENNPFFTDTKEGGEVDDRAGARNALFASSNLNHFHNSSTAAPSTKAKQTPIKALQPDKETVFPYTSDLLSFPSLSSKTTSDDLEHYGAQIKSKSKGKKGKQKELPFLAYQNNDLGDDMGTMLFKPRNHSLLNPDAFGPDRNCFSDQDVNDSDITDLETDPEGALSDTEGITSSRLIPVVKTENTIAVDAILSPRNKNSTSPSDNDTDLEVTDYEAEEELLARKLRQPRILPGAQAAHEMNAARRVVSAKSRDYIPPNTVPSSTASAQARRRGGSQNDSRRRYLALNSLRRKAYELKEESRKKPPSPKTKQRTAQLLSYNTRKFPQSTIMSQV